MAQNILCISEFATKLVAGIAGLALAIAIAVIIIVAKNKKD